MIQLCLVAGALAGNFGKELSGPFAVETLRIEWRDSKRDHTVPVKIYFPKGATGACPVIVFSHGLGGTRDTYEYLGRHWAGHGYVCVHVQHPGSDDSAWRGAARPMESMRAATMDPKNLANRPQDVSFALDQMTILNSSEGPLRGRLDLQRVGMAGHSFGAWTTLAVAGQKFGPTERSMADRRVNAAIAMSSPVPRLASGRHYGDIRVPVFHLTGTLDESPLNETKAGDRRVPFDSINGAPQYLLTFTGGDHMVFSGRVAAGRDRARDVAIHEAILRGTTAFWDARLRGDKEAGDWFERGGFEKALGALAVFEMRNNGPR